MRNTELVQWFRQSTPYVNLHQGKTFVLMLDGEVVASPNCVNIINDISLLHSLGIKLVIVFGARPQINDLLAQHQIEPHYYNHIRITDNQTLEIVKQAVGRLHYDLVARLSLRLPHSQVINVVSGNPILAQPIGVVDGVDYALSGKIRRINIDLIRRQLDENSVVLVSPIAPSVTGEMFNLPFEEIATQLAIKLNADKLIGFCAEQGLYDAQGEVISELSPQAGQSYLEKLVNGGQYHTPSARFLHAAVAVCQAGVKRAHLISYQEDGALLQEIFSRDGLGTQISIQSSEQIRLATAQDLPALLELIRPLEQQGILIKRSREQLEMEIHCYTIIEKDGVVIACAALYPYPEEKMAEMACVVVHPEYRDSARGDALLAEIQRQAHEIGAETLFVLTTRTTQWFQERGFTPAGIADLPKYKRDNYNYQRRSKVLLQPLTSHN